MRIHVVQTGETIYSIAELYGVSADRIILENEVTNPIDLVPGETIVVTFPEQTYTVQEGDTLLGIADANGISILQLLRNNPNLSEREYIYPGEILIISYNVDKIRKITTNGYANEFINEAVLRKTLPYLTYLSVFGYRIIEGGEIIEVEDTSLIETVRDYGVAPLLILSTLSTVGQGNIEAAYNLLNNEVLMDRLIDNILSILQRKRYYGLNIAYQLLNSNTLPSYELLNSKLYQRLKSEGFALFISIAPNVIFAADRISFEKIDFTKIFQETDGVIILNYLWGAYAGPPGPLASITKINEFLDFIIPQVTPDKLVIGMPLIAYEWELPYSIGLSRANALTLDNALELANQHGSTIQFDEVSQTPYFTYNTSSIGIAREHVVWFVDARSFDAILKTITERDLNASGFWNINTFIPQLWLVINIQYVIEHISDIL